MERDERSPEEIGAGTGIAARDAGEEGLPAGLDALPGSGAAELTDERQRWEAVGEDGEAVTEEGAAGGGLRDEQVRETEEERPERD